MRLDRFDRISRRPFLFFCVTRQTSRNGKRESKEGRKSEDERKCGLSPAPFAPLAPPLRRPLASAAAMAGMRLYFNLIMIITTTTTTTTIIIITTTTTTLVITMIIPTAGSPQGWRRTNGVDNHHTHTHTHTHTRQEMPRGLTT